MVILKGRPKWWQFNAKRQQRARVAVLKELRDRGALSAHELMKITGMNSGRVYIALMDMWKDGRTERDQATLLWVAT